MKRINYLFALALPALMAACTQEELVTSDAGNNGLKLVENPIENFSLKVDIEDEVGTRMVGNKFEVGDQMGLVWFNPWYNQGLNQLTGKEYYANNRMTISKDAAGDGVWTSDAVIMEGTHFAYLPFQTKWENQDEYPLQVKGGKEALQVYNETDQKDDVNNRLYWANNHATYLSPAYEFTVDNDGAGISEERRIGMKIFSNRLSIKPEFKNIPAGMVLYGYELRAAEFYGRTYSPFVTHAEILAHKLPKSEEFGGCNWATLNTTPNTKLSDFYKPIKHASSLSVTYANQIDPAQAPKFMFLLLPALKSTFPNYWNNDVYKASEIELVAHTNYGDIVIKDVTGQFDANMMTEKEISLSELYYNGVKVNEAEDATSFVGFVNIAGTTRGDADKDGNIVATFDCNNIEFKLPEVCSNETLERALDMIKSYQAIKGDACQPSFALQLCHQPVFTDLDFTGTLNDFMEETGLEISVTGYNTWTDEDGTLHTYSEITWKGNSKLDQVIPYTENFVADDATLTTKSEKNIVKITVQDGGRLTNNGLASTVIVEEGGSATNNGTIKTVNNYGTLTNAMAATAAAEDQPTIGKLSNYNRVTNYATLTSVARNTKEDGTPATIELRDNTRKGALGTLGSIFKVDASAAENGRLGLGIIKYDLDSATPADAGTDLAHALNNYATQITVDAAVTEIKAPESAAFKNANSRYKNDFDRAQITFEGNTEYSIDNKTATGSELALGEIVLKDGVTLTVSNAYYTGNNSGATDSAYALVADELTMGNNATVDVKEITTVVAEALNIADGVTATVKTVAGEEMLSAFYYGTKFGDGTLTTSGNINTNIPTDCKKYFK